MNTSKSNTKRDENSTSIIKSIIEKSKKIIYIITIEYGNIIVKNSKNILHNQDLELLSFANTDNCEILKNILSSLIYKFKRYPKSNYVKNINEIGKSILYVFLILDLSIEGNFIIKVGYTSNFDSRYKQLLKDHNVKELYLIYVQAIKFQPEELELYTRLKIYDNIIFYPVTKYSSTKVKEKIEKKSLCVETYIFDYTTLETIIKEIHNDVTIFNGINI